MAIARLSVGVGWKGKASPHAQYIAREGKYEKPSDSLEKLEHTEHGNMPQWAQADPNFFWKMADEHERKNGSTYREHVISLPRELSESQRLALIHDWIDQEIGDKHAYQFAIHNPPALDGQEQPHCHLMFSERTIDGIDRDPDQYFKRYNAKNPDKGGAKKANTGIAPADRRAELSEQRDRWEQICNKHLELAHSDARISMKSLAAQGIDREPLNVPMIQLNKLNAAIEFKQAKIESLAVNVIDELTAINEKYNEQADQAINRASHAINRSQRISTGIEQWTDSTNKANTELSRRLERGKHQIESSRQVSAVADRTIDSSKRLAAVADRAIISSKQLAAVTDQAIARRIAQRETQQQEVERISQRPISELLRLEFRVQVVNEYGNNRSETVARVNDDFHDYYRQARREKMQLVISNKDRNGKLTNPETEGNKTAQAIERFMLKKENLSNLNILDDFDSKMSVQDFTKKYGLECDISDLKRLDELYPIEPKQTLKTANLSEPRPKNDNDHGFSM